MKCCARFQRNPDRLGESQRGSRSSYAGRYRTRRALRVRHWSRPPETFDGAWVNSLWPSRVVRLAGSQNCTEGEGGDDPDTLELTGIEQVPVLAHQVIRLPRQRRSAAAKVLPSATANSALARAMRSARSLGARATPVRGPLATQLIARHQTTSRR